MRGMTAFAGCILRHWPAAQAALLADKRRLLLWLLHSRPRELNKPCASNLRERRSACRGEPHASPDTQFLPALC